MNPLAKYYETEAKPHPISLYVKGDAKAKMDSYVRQIPTEVGWMGFISEHERVHEDTNMALPSLLILEDVFLYEQEVSGGSVEADGVDTSQVLQQLIDEGKDDKISQLRFFAHSHVNMGAYHSGVDTGMIDDWAATGLDWFISHVQNKRGEIDCRFDMFLPFRVSCPVQEVVVLSQEFEDAVTEEILEKVKKKQYVQSWKPAPNRASQDTSRWRQDRDRNGSDTKEHLPGRVISEESQDPGHVMADKRGTVEHPVIKHTRKTYDGKSFEVRQEIVEGCIIHESISGSPAAKARLTMTLADRWAYYKEYKSDNPSLADPTQERLDEFKEDKKEESSPQSRSIQRSEDKKRPETKDQSKDTSSKTDDKPQTQTQSEVKKGSQKGKKDDKGDQSKKSSEPKGKKQTIEEQQESLVVVEESDGEKKEETSLADRSEEELEATIEQQLQAGFMGLGFTL